MTIDFSHLSATLEGMVDQRQVTAQQSLNGSATAYYQVDLAENQIIISDFGGEGVQFGLDINGQRVTEGNLPAYTTVQTIVRRLEEKGAVRRVRKIGNAFVFEPVVSRGSTIKRLLDELLYLVDGSPKPLMAQLVETGNLTVEDLQEMEELLEANQARERETGKDRRGGRR